jgi:hypothetical protein
MPSIAGVGSPLSAGELSVLPKDSLTKTSETLQAPPDIA